MGAIQRQTMHGYIVSRFGDVDPYEEGGLLVRCAVDDHTPPGGASARNGEGVVLFRIRTRAQAAGLAGLEGVDESLGGAEGRGAGSVRAIRATCRRVLVANYFGDGIPRRDLTVLF